MRILFVSISLLLLSLNLVAQSPVKGSVRDTMDKKFLPNAVVALIQKKDSSLYKFVRTAKDGSFQFPQVAAGKYQLLVSYPKFADYTDDIEIKTEPLNLGAIPLTQQAQLLQAVIIKSAGAIRIKGDTTEFVADSFKVREGATVEELLKKLPGFQVNSKGEIVAQGQRVDKVLVDGEEFFGDDPTMATRNIGAKAVDKVQVFDTKSETQQLTGMTNGQEGKTVNIKLKEDQKKGGFGRFNAATDFNRYHDVNLMYNKFVGKKKFSVYGNKSTTSTGSLNWDDRRKLGLDNDYEFDEISGGMYFEMEDDGFSGWNFRGLPDAYTAGALFSNKWAEDRQNVNGSYRYNRLGMQNQGSTLTQNILKDTLFYTNQYQNQKNVNQQHAFNGKWEWKPDSLSTIKLTTALTRRESEFDNSTFAESLSEERDTVNTSNRVNEGFSNKRDADNNLSYKRLFKKAGRQLQANFRFRYTEEEQNSFLRFQNRYFKSNLADSTENADQQKLNDNQATTLGAKFTYAEPLSTKWSLILSYAYTQNDATSKRNTFDRSANGKYENRNRLFSNNFDMEAHGHSGSVISRYNTKKLKFALGSGVSSTRFNLLNIDSNRKYNFNFLNLTPQANVNYTMQANSNLFVSYNGSTVQPNIEQLQPLRNNADPLNIVIGNPALEVGFRHRINLGYYSYKMLKQLGIWTNFSYTVTNNAISNNTTVQPNGKRTTQAVNVNGNSNWNYWLEFNKGEGEKKLIYSLSLNAFGSTYNNLVNSLENRTRSLNLSFGYGLRYEVDQKWALHIRPNIGWSRSESSLNPSARTSFLTYGGNAEGRLNLPWKLEIQSDVNFDWRQRISAFDANPNITYWKAELRKKVFKDNSGIISLVANDILDSYRGFNRIINSNFITEERYQRVGQYFQFKLEWTFNKMGGQ
ncbi:MAG TPA: TonB-dependent receptor [Flavisolibacter sp.]|nr:TonB-dependent receptor [Flavisolibacter sp.]